MKNSRVLNFEERMNSEFERNETIRKSIRKPKKMAPQPPTTSVQLDHQLHSKNMSPTPIQRTKPASPTLSRISPSLQRKLSGKRSDGFVTESSSSRSTIDNTSVVKLSDLKITPSSAGASSIGNTGNNNRYTNQIFGHSTVGGKSVKAKMDFFNMESHPKIKPTEEDASKIALDELEKHISSLETNTKIEKLLAKTSEKSVVPKVVNNKTHHFADNEKAIRPQRYGEMESLLNTGISDVASGNGLCYLEKYDNDNSTDNIESSGNFKRGEDSRNSTGGAIALTSKFLQSKSKQARPASRTSSDTKNVENTIKNMRQVLKKQELLKKTAPPTRNYECTVSKSESSATTGPRIVSEKPKGSTTPIASHRSRPQSPETRRHVITPTSSGHSSHGQAKMVIYDLILIFLLLLSMSRHNVIQHETTSTIYSTSNTHIFVIY